MGDIQFKSYLKLLIHSLETIENKESLEEIRKEIAKLKHDLELDMQR